MSTNAMSNNASPSQNSALYQYAVPAAVFIFAAVSITIYFRSSVRQRSPTGTGAVVALRAQQGAHNQFDPGMKPPLFEAFLVSDGADEGQRQLQWDTEAQAPLPSGEWVDIMPLSVANIITGAEGAAARATKRASAVSPSPPPEVDPRPPDANANATANLNHSSSAASLGLISDPAHVLVSVVVRMPVAPTPEAAPTAGGVDVAGGAEDVAEDDIEEAPLPYLELGLVEVDVLGAGDSTQGVTS